MKLYYLPGACSLASHIALREAGADFELERFDKTSKKTESGADFLAINPKGYVPVLSLDSGDVLTEGPAILQYIADQNPKAGLAPDAGTLARTRLQEQLNFISTDLHKSFSPLFNPTSSDAEKAAARTRVIERMGLVEKMLADGRIDVYALPYLSLADAIAKAGGDNLEIVGPIENTPIFCAGTAFPKDATALRDDYNKVLAEMKKDGSFAEIVKPFGFEAMPAMMVTTEELCNRKVE